MSKSLFVNCYLSRDHWENNEERGVYFQILPRVGEIVVLDHSAEDSVSYRVIEVIHHIYSTISTEKNRLRFMV